MTRNPEREGTCITQAPSLIEALGNIVSMCADARDIFPDSKTALEGVTEMVNELYACLEDGVFDERAAILKWLRERANISDEEFYSAFAYAADVIERGEHLAIESAQHLERGE